MILLWFRSGTDGDNRSADCLGVILPPRHTRSAPLPLEVPACAYDIRLANPACKLFVEVVGFCDSEVVHEQALGIWIRSSNPRVVHPSLEVEVSIEGVAHRLGAGEPPAGPFERDRRLRHRNYDGTTRLHQLHEPIVKFDHGRGLPLQIGFNRPGFRGHDPPQASVTPDRKVVQFTIPYNEPGA